MADDAQEIRGVHSAWIDAVNAGDLERLLGLMADDAVFINPGRAPFGREVFAPSFLDAHRQARIRCSSELEEVVVAGEVAYTRSRDALTVSPRSGGDAQKLAGHRVTLYRRKTDGRWLLARDIHTLGPAPT